jgi:hypothetical protein
MIRGFIVHVSQEKDTESSSSSSSSSPREDLKPLKLHNVFDSIDPKLLYHINETKSTINQRSLNAYRRLLQRINQSTPSTTQLNIE